MFENIKTAIALSKFIGRTCVSVVKSNVLFTNFTPFSILHFLWPSRFRRHLTSQTPYSYIIRTHTADDLFAGTDGFIWICLLDRDGNASGWQILDNPDTNDFKKGAIDEFLVHFPNHIGDIKAIMIKNEGGGLSQEWHLLKIEVEQPGKKLLFPANTWIQQGTTRVFFDTTSTTAEQTLEGLRKYRIQELDTQKKVYSFRIYDDLSKGSEARDELPRFPKRQQGNDQHLPFDERFSFTKSKGFGRHVLLGLVPRTILDIITNASAEKTNQLEFVEWNDFHDLHQAYWIMGFIYFPVPLISKRWRLDEEFGRQRLAGVNPCFVQLVEPDDTLLASIGVTDDLLEKVFPQGSGKTLSGEIAKKKIYSINYRLFLQDWKDKFNDPVLNQKDRYVASPIGVFWSTPDRQFVPLAISLEEGEERPYTPLDKEEDWILAKIYFASAESTIHQLYTHYVRSHAVSEVFAIASRRNLFAAHPIFKLLKPHLRYTIAINAKARAKLISADGHFEHAFYSGKLSMPFGEDVYNKFWNWKDQSLKRDLKNRKVDDADALPNYPYRDDGLEIWNAIKSMVNGYIDVYYKSDEEVANDSELQNFWKEATEIGHYQKEFPKLNTKQALSKALRRIIWLATGHHACINFPQYGLTSYALNQPPHTRRPPPRQRGIATKETIMATIPDLKTCCLAIAVTKTLSSYAEKGEEEYLGHPKEVLVYDNAAVQVLEKFKMDLAEIEKTLHRIDTMRTALNGGMKYDYLHPSKITNSVAV